MKHRRGAVLVLKLLVSCILIGWLYWSTPLTEIWELMKRVDYLYMLPILVLLFANTILSAWKWRLLLLADDVDVQLKILVRTYLVGSFYNLFLPSNIGGDSYRIYDIGRRSRETVRSAASVFADRFSGFLAMVVLALSSSVIVVFRIGKPVFLIGPFVLFICMVLVLFALYRQTPFRFMLAVTRMNAIPAVVRITEKLFLSFERYGSNPGMLCRIMLISFTFQLSVIVVIYLLAKALHASVSFFFFSAFVPLITLMEALPISIYGIGVRDAGYVFFFGWAGLSEIQTRSLALLFLAMTVTYSLIGGLILLWKMFYSDSPDSSLSQDCQNQ